MSVRPTEQQTLHDGTVRDGFWDARMVTMKCRSWQGKKVVLAYDTNVPQQWNERRWSRNIRPPHTHE